MFTTTSLPRPTGGRSDFRSKEGPAQGLFADMRVTLTQAREATADLADNMEAMKHNFLLRGFFNARGYYDLEDISPAEYRAGALQNGGRLPVRVWLGANRVHLFLANTRLAPPKCTDLRIDGHHSACLRRVPTLL